jgi:riboflavin biosynthesis pyrimidine reductase
VRTLLEHDLVDEFRLMIDPVVVGGGTRISSATTARSGRCGSSTAR